MLKIAEPIHFVTGQTWAVSAIKKKVSTVVAHLIDIDYQTPYQHRASSLLTRSPNASHLPLEPVAKKKTETCNVSSSERVDGNSQ